MLLSKRIPISYVLGKVKTELMYTFIIGVVTLVLTHVFHQHVPEIPIAIPAFIGTAISVLLSFKLNQSYDRWWEARKIWGAIVNDSRSFVLQLQLFVNSDFSSHIKTMVYRHIAWLYALSESLRGQNPMSRISNYISIEEAALVATHQNRALALLQLNSQSLKQMREENALDVFSLVQMNSTMMLFSNHMGMCERIKSTVFPVTYRQYLHGIIYLFTVCLSISLQDIAFYIELPLLMAISGAFFLLEKSATFLQDPFSNLPTDTAMTAISRTIEINVLQLLGEETIPSPIAPNEFYIL